ncbi:ATP-binding cassette domain-containing protein, partial [Rhizobium ruizarguesonis]
LTAHRQQVQLVMQDPDDQLFSADVRSDIAYGPTNLGLAEDEIASRVDEALAVLSLTHLAERPVHRLSFGQRKRVAVAGALAMHPTVLLLDE